MLPLTPFVEPGVGVFLAVVDEVFVVDSEDGDVVEDESDDLSAGGLADAAHGAAANPTPIPSATASPPIRPMYRAYPMIILPRVELLSKAGYVRAERTNRVVEYSKIRLYSA
jgi:hypothetical protein